MKIFLSYSSADRVLVKRLADDLQKQGHTVCLDSLFITGSFISQDIEKGIAESDVFALWLSKRSVLSTWVNREWRSSLHGPEPKKIIPLLGDDVEIPLLLRDCKCADFRDDFKRGLRELIAALKASPPTPLPLPQGHPDHTISGHVGLLLQDLSKCYIPFPLSPPIHLLRTLKQLPRSGKKLRLETYEMPVRIRSVFDHILSVAHSADCLLYTNDIVNSGRNRNDLALCIVYHDLCEVILGDIPNYTNLTNRKRGRARVFAEARFSELPDGHPEDVVNDFIHLFLTPRERDALKQVIELAHDKENPVWKFFRIIDKIDPIVAVWRYLHLYRGRLDRNACRFLERMKDFFDNPKVLNVTQQNSNDCRLEELVRHLQNREAATDYYNDKDCILPDSFCFEKEIVAKLITGRGFEYATMPTSERFGSRAPLVRTK